MLYQCNFDKETILHHCFTTPISVVSNVRKPDILVPTAPFSDVTSSLKPTENGEVCRLPYRINNFDWDMYFCNDDHCPTANNPNSRCQDGKFGTVELFDTAIKSYQLSTPTGGIYGTEEQCLVYYYYMSIASETNITILKAEKGSREEIIDLVSDNPFNGWIRRNISYTARTSDYKIYFLAQKLSFSGTPYVAFDEISIRQGDCDDEPVTTSETVIQTTITMPIISSTTTSNENTNNPTTEPETFSIPISSVKTDDSTLTTTIQSSLSSTTVPTTSSTSSTSSPIGTTTRSEESSSTSTIPLTSNHETTISTIETSTLSTAKDIVASTYMNILPLETSHIIILSTVIPLVWIAFIIVLFWIKKSGNTFGGTSKSSTYKLNDVSQA